MEFKDFEDYLQYVHMDENPTLLDDDLPDHFGEWLSQLDSDEWIVYGDRYAKHAVKADQEKAQEIFEKVFLGRKQ